MTIQDFADPNGLVAKGLLSLFATPAWMPAAIAGVFSIFLVILLLLKERTQSNAPAPAATPVRGNGTEVAPSAAEEPQKRSEPIAKTVAAQPAALSDYDRDRRRREIDELIASITAGKTLQSLKDAGALAHLLQSAIYTGHSVAEFKEELIKVQNALVAAGNERLQIANRYPEHRDILNLIERKDQIVADAASDPHDLGIWPPVHAYLANPNIPNEALTPPNVATWIFLKDTKVIRELNARLFGYCDWCEKVKAALVEKRRALD